MQEETLSVVMPSGLSKIHPGTECDKTQVRSCSMSRRVASRWSAKGPIASVRVRSMSA